MKIRQTAFPNICLYILFFFFFFFFFFSSCCRFVDVHIGIFWFQNGIGSISTSRCWWSHSRFPLWIQLYLWLTNWTPWASSRIESFFLKEKKANGLKGSKLGEVQQSESSRSPQILGESYFKRFSQQQEAKKNSHGWMCVWLGGDDEFPLLNGIPLPQLKQTTGSFLILGEYIRIKSRIRLLHKWGNHKGTTQQLRWSCRKRYQHDLRNQLTDLIPLRAICFIEIHKLLWYCHFKTLNCNNFRIFDMFISTPVFFCFQALDLFFLHHPRKAMIMSSSGEYQLDAVTQYRKMLSHLVEVANREELSP